MISFFAKKARGLMAAYIIKYKLTNPEDLKAFNIDGYTYYKSKSSAKNWVFQRKQ